MHAQGLGRVRERMGSFRSGSLLIATHTARPLEELRIAVSVYCIVAMDWVEQQREKESLSVVLVCLLFFLFPALTYNDKIANCLLCTQSRSASLFPSCRDGGRRSCRELPADCTWTANGKGLHSNVTCEGG